MPSLTDISQTPTAERDEYRTPPYIFRWLDREFAFDLDLAATEDNALCVNFFTQADDSLLQRWHGAARRGFCNPPYSRVAPWLSKAIEEGERGFTSVFLLHAPNGEKYWGDYVFAVASELRHITGRLSYLRPDGGVAYGNMRASCVVVYRGFSLGDTRYRHFWRDHLKHDYEL